jgi:hypothetical protein
MQDNKTLPSLSLDDLEISNLEVYGLSREEAIGVPEMGASSGNTGCCTCCNCCPPKQEIVVV